MLVGALMVVAPSAGADDVSPEFTVLDKVTVCHRTNAVTNPYRIIEVAVDGSDGSLGNGRNDHTSHLGEPFDFGDPGSYTPPFNGDDWGDIIPPYQWGPDPEDRFEGLNWDINKTVTQQCRGTEGDPTTLTLVKAVRGDAAPTTWSYDFTGLVDTVTLTHDGATSDALEIDPNVTYDITESGTDGVVTANCVGAATQTLVGRQLSVSVAAGGDAICTFTNTFGQTSSIVVEKTNDASGDATYGEPEAASGPGANVPFQVVIRNTGTRDLTFESLTDAWEGQAPMSLLSVPGFGCTRGGSGITLAAGDTLSAGSVTTCKFTLTGYGPTSGSKINTVAVTTEENIDDDDTSTVTYTPQSIDIIPDVVVTPASLTVVKDVQGGDAVPGSWTEFIGVGNVGPGTTVSNILLRNGDATETRSSLAPGIYVLDELGSDIDTMELTDISCSDANAAAASSFARVDADDLRDGISVTLAQGSNVTCVFENTYTASQVLPEEEEPGTITIIKAVEGPAPTDGWAFGFNVSDGVGRTVLTDADSETTFGPLDAGRYTIVEDSNSVTTLKSIVCTDPDAVSNGRTVTVDVGEGEDVECTFTNVFPEPKPATAVLGDVVTRPQTLPRTGGDTKGLAGAGVLLVALGAALVLGSKRQLAQR